MLSIYQSRPRILIASIDYDDCLSIRRQDDLIATIELKKHLVSNIHSNYYQQVILMVGSSRQSQETAEMPLIVLKKLCNEIYIETNVPCTVDECLLSNVYRRSYLLRDQYKCSMKYFQIHKKASDFHYANIDYHFYDNEIDILKFLYLFYSKETELMPFNLTAQLYQYDGEVINHHYSIQGSGIIDYQYADNFNFMAECAKYGLTHDLGDVLDGNSNQLYQFKAGRYLQPKDISLELLNEIRFIANNRPSRYKQRDYEHFIQSLYILHTEIERDMIQLMHNHNAEEIRNSNTVKIARETRYMLLHFKSENVHREDETCINFNRNGALVHYGENLQAYTQLLQIAMTALILSSAFLLSKSCNSIAMIWSEWEKQLTELFGFTKKNIYFCFRIKHDWFSKKIC